MAIRITTHLKVTAYSNYNLTTITTQPITTITTYYGRQH